METPRFVGIDVVKGELVVAALPGNERWTVENDEKRIRTLVERLKHESLALVVLEATGGYKLRAVSALASASLPVVVVNPRQVRDFARGTGQLAKTDRIDARILALLVSECDPRFESSGGRGAAGVRCPSYETWSAHRDALSREKSAGSDLGSWDKASEEKS